MRIDETSEGPRPPPIIDWTFKEALEFLRLHVHSRPSAPPLIFTDPRISKDTKNTSCDWDFSSVWKYLEDASGGKTAEERLGDYAWVLEYGKKTENTELPVVVRLSEEDTVVATSEDSDSHSNSGRENSTDTRISLAARSVSPQNNKLVLSSIASKKGVETSKLQILHGKPIKPVPTIRPTFVTNASNVSHPYNTSSFPIIHPMTYQTHLEKKRQIVKKLYRNLANRRLKPDLCPVLEMSPSYPYDFIRSHSDRGGLHVFVDISNIFHCFTELLRRIRGIHSRVQHPLFNFTDFSFILERCRPTTRRVLVGSCSNDQKMPYHIEATHCGYEVNLLERVYKTRLPTSTRRIPNSSGYASASDATPIGSRSNGEQGVDEILQMKMLESLVDAEAPSTLVLATGDAAVAEYSGGFLVNVKRALQKGWKVEVVSWQASMSQAYVRLAEEWREKLQIIFLDDMAEDLLAWYSPEQDRA